MEVSEDQMANVCNKQYDGFYKYDEDLISVEQLNDVVRETGNRKATE